MPLFLLSILGNRFGQLALVALAALLTGFFLGFYSVPQVDVPAIVRNAQDGRDAYWQRKQIEVNEAHEHTLAEAIAARDATPAIAPDADLGKLCDTSATCRDKAPSGKHRLQGVQKHKLGKSRHKADRAANPGS